MYLTLFAGLLIFVVFWVLLYQYVHRSGSVSGRLVVVTGGATGIGLQLAHQLLVLGAHVVIWGDNSESLSKADSQLRRISPHVHSMVVDVSDRNAVREAAERVSQRIGRVHILINNAGVAFRDYLGDMNEELMERTMRTNAMAHFWTVKAFLPAMVAANDGHIVTVSSCMALTAIAGLSAYTASKWAAMGFHESIRFELKRLKAHNVHTTLVLPYVINTGMFHGVKQHFQWLVPNLSPEYAASQIVDAIQRRYPMLVMPPLLGWAAALSRLLPVWLSDWLMGLMGATDAMQSFIGRSHPPNSSPTPLAHPSPSLLQRRPSHG